MRIAVNLASEPFRRDRPIFVASVACAVVLVLLLGAQVYLILVERGRAAENREAVAALNAQIAQAGAEQATLDATLLEPRNAEVLQRSLLLNSLIERKSISWAQLLADIENVLPNRARLIQVRLPQINTRNEVTLDLDVGAETQEAGVDFMRRLEESPLFGPVQLSREDPPTQNEPSFRYRLTVSYAQRL
jgi:type IV pilus assembly protein PilN